MKAEPRREVFLATPGGLGQRGGMGQVAVNLVEAWSRQADAPPFRVIDSWPGEWRLRFSARSPLVYAKALLVIALARLTGRLGILHLHMASRGSVLRKGLLVWLGCLTGVPVIVHSAAADLDSFWARLPAPGRRLLRTTLRRARFLVVLGSYWRRFFVDTMGLPAAQVIVIPNGVADPGEPATRPVDGPCRLLFLGRLGERKGTPMLLDALADPVLRELGWTLTLAGDGAVEEMRAQAQALGISARTTFLGWVDSPQVGDLLARSDALLLPSRQEGLPMAILEAMASGLAIVTTRAGSIEDAVTDDENGLLVPVDDVAALKRALLRLMTEPELRRRLQDGARARYVKDYRAATMARCFTVLYHAAGLAEPPAGPQPRPTETTVGASRP